MISEGAAEIFLEARTLDPQARAEYLSAACGSSKNLLDEVTSLLEASNESQVYFEKLAGKIGLDALADDEHGDIPGDKLFGSWRLVKEIGRGGMGAVYLAERADEHFEQRAALKVLPTGLNTDQARARFLIERQILARLVHDNIARLLDGGVTEDGLPYFVMDYVEGLPIDEYCNENNLDVGSRLALVLDVAKAVQYAHRNLIIHRDLKPSNVLVDQSGRVRLLDFGIAKMLDTEPGNAHLTKQSRRPATPAFASPEMLCGEAVDVTTDVYSIGALMYVLLAGRLPLDYDGLSLTQMLERATAEIPAPVSRRNPQIGSDLDAIVAKSLAKLPEERYASVESLANDIRNFLGGLPVTAETPSVFYRVRKFVGRHRMGVAFSIFAVLALASLAGVAVRSAIVSDRQARQIALERDRAEQTKDFLISIFDSADPNVTPGEQSAREILEAGRARIADELAAQPEVQADLLRAMSMVYQAWRMVPEGREVLERELTLRETVNGRNTKEYADALIGLAYFNEIGGDYESSIDYARRALQISEDIDHAMGRAIGNERIGRVLHLQGDFDGARVHFNRGLELVIAHEGENSIQAAFIREHLANLYVHQEQYEEALDEFARTLAIHRMHVQGDSAAISPIYLGMGSALRQLGRLDEAAEAYDKGLAMNERLYGADNSYSFYFVNGLGKVAEDKGDLDTATSRYEDARRLILLHVPESPNLAFASANVGKVRMMRGLYDAALPFYREALAIIEQKLPTHRVMGEVKWRLGRCLVASGEYDEAESLIIAGIDIVEKQWGPDHEISANARAAAALLYDAWGKRERAEAFR